MSDPHYDKVSLLLPMSGANNGTTFTDWSPSPKIVTRFGDTKTVTAQSKYYGSSGYFDGSGDYLTVPNSATVTGNIFTIEFWVYINNLSNQATYYDQRASNNDAGFALFTAAGGTGMAVWGNGAIQVATGAGHISTSVWQHIAFVMDGSVQRLYVNGVQKGTTPAAWNTNAGGCLIAKAVDSSVYNLNGHIQDLRITKGVARYTANFTPPERLIQTLSGTVLDATGQPAQRQIITFPRLAPSVPNKITTSDPVTGAWSLAVPDTPHTVIALGTGSENALVLDHVNPA